MFQIVYVSATVEPMCDDAPGITGMLLCKNQRFMQTLEGKHVYSSRSRCRFFVDFSHTPGSPLASPS